ncbi:hypothetical protein SEVIR_9G352850v4 [Setaria viridis]
MNPVARTLFNSTLMASLQSWAKRRSFCLTGRAVLLRSKECSASSLGTPGISDGFHANMSKLCWRKLVSACSYFSERSTLMRAVLVGFSRPRQIFLTLGLGCSTVDVGSLSRIVS